MRYLSGALFLTYGVLFDGHVSRHACYVNPFISADRRENPGGSPGRTPTALTRSFHGRVERRGGGSQEPGVVRIVLIDIRERSKFPIIFRKRCADLHAQLSSINLRKITLNLQGNVSQKQRQVHFVFKRNTSLFDQTSSLSSCTS